MKTVILAHYYTSPEIQKMADKVGDSLDLSLYARDCGADRIVFAGVKFMAETAKIINPKATVILPDVLSTCSLVTQTNINELRKWREEYSDYTHVAYINSSAEHKAISDWIVTSRNVSEIIEHLYNKGEKVIFSPDRNMGAYLNYEYGYNMPLWSAVCEVHDKFNEEALDELIKSSKGTPVLLLSHPESPLPILKKSNYIGSTSQMLNYIKNFTGDNKSKFLIATEDGILYNMRQARPDLDIVQAPIYNGCQCNSCPYMKKNTIESVNNALMGKGFVIDYLSEDLMRQARIPIEKMLEFKL